MGISPRRRRGPGTVRRRHRQGTRGFCPELQPLEGRQLLSTTPTFQPTPYEQYMLELINAARANPTAAGQKLVAIAQTDPYIHQIAVNSGLNLSQFFQVISSYGPEAPLAFNPRLIEAARDQSLAMLATNNQFHSPADYLTNPSSGRASDGQVFYPTGMGAWTTGENVFAYSEGIGGTDPKPYVDYFNTAFFLDWGNPDFGHLRNLLNPSFREVGVGLLNNVIPTVAPSAYNPTPANQGMNVGPDIVTQEFGARQGQYFLTGSFSIDRDGNNFYTPGEGLGGVTITAVGTGGQGVFQTQTWNAGGYSLQLPSGTYVVKATGNLPSTQTYVVTIGQSNAWWEVRFPANSQVQVRSVSTADQPVPGDYYGNGKTDFAVYRSSTSQWFIGGQSQPIQFGAPGVDIPVPGDYDGSGRTELAVYRPTTGQWFISGDAKPVQFGAPGVDIPVPGDYDGSGRTELAVYRPSTGQWFVAGQAKPTQIGMPGQDVPVAGDFDGDGKTDPAVFRPSTAQWIYAGSSAGARSVQYGTGGTLPAPTTWLSNAVALNPRSPVAAYAVSAARSSSGLGSGQSLSSVVSLLGETPWAGSSQHQGTANVKRVHKPIAHALASGTHHAPGRHRPQSAPAARRPHV